MNRTIFIQTVALMEISRYPYQWKIGEGGEETETDCQIYICLKEEVKVAKMT